jgi:hypothetical protein
MGDPPAVNRLYFGDCLEVMREDIPDESVDLIYLDPPFNSKRLYNAYIGGAQWVAFNDTWQWYEAIEDFHEVAGDVTLGDTMEGLRRILGEGPNLAYLSYMANRLRECLPAACQGAHFPPETPATPPDTTAETPPGDDDQRAVIAAPLALNVPEGGAGSYTVVLGAQPTGPVTVTPTVASAELTPTPAQLRFTPADWRAAQTVTVTAVHDEDAVADAPVQVAHTARGGGYRGTAEAPIWVTIIEDDVSTIVDHGDMLSLELSSLS